MRFFSITKNKEIIDNADMKNKKNAPNIKGILSHLISGIRLASSFWLVINMFSINLVDNPVETLYLIWVITDYSLISSFYFVI
jgi:hypothetical protein